jgi:hypothetical protein
MSEPSNESPKKSFPVVGIGASASGLEAGSQIIAALPASTGIAFILVEHLDPRHQSLLTEILTKRGPITVGTATDGAMIEPDHLYVIPRNNTLTVAGGLFRLSPRDTADGDRISRSIVSFVHSLRNMLTSQWRWFSQVRMGTELMVWKTSRLPEESRWHKSRRRRSSVACRKLPLLPVASTSCYLRSCSSAKYFE